MDLRKDLEETSALLSGHFRLSSGLHSDRYLQCARLLQWPDRAERIGRALAERMRPYGAAVVVSPALGGVLVGHETARALGVRSIFTERKDGHMQLRRGFAFSEGEPAIVVEDVFTTGKSTRETIEAVSALGAKVLAAASIVDRGMSGENFPVPYHSLLRLEVPSWPQESCPLCAEGYPLDAPGSRFSAKGETDGPA